MQNSGIREKWDEIKTDTNSLIKIIIQDINEEFIWLYHVSQLNEGTLTLPIECQDFGGGSDWTESEFGSAYAIL